MPNIDTLIAYEAGQLDIEAAIDFIQDGIDRGWVWQLQGSYVRTAVSMINAGLCRHAG